MTKMIFAAQNERHIPKEDKIFGISNRAKAMIQQEGRDKVINATIGALLDDDGKLIVLSSVEKVFRGLEASEFAEYAPIGGTAEFREAVKRDLFRSFKTQRFAEAVATPGGTGSIRNTVSNYSSYGDKVLTTDWNWAPYASITEEIGRRLETFELFNSAGAFNGEDFERKVFALLKEQERLVIILNTPSHNPTGYALSNEEWEQVVCILNEASQKGKITLLVDAAYVDFAGDEEESRGFLPYLEKLNESVLPVVAHSLSKSYTLYGLRCGAMICMARERDIAEEFKRVCEFSARATWSNCPKAPQVILSKIYSDGDLLHRVMEERKKYREMLISRGKAFMEAAQAVDLHTLPFRSGFFATVPCENPDEISSILEKEGIFVVPLGKGLRISGASVSEESCRKLPKAIKAAMDR